LTFLVVLDLVYGQAQPLFVFIKSTCFVIDFVSPYSTWRNLIRSMTPSGINHMRWIHTRLWISACSTQECFGTTTLTGAYVKGWILDDHHALAHFIVALPFIEIGWMLK